jgi:ubiquinone/menaquinone biosynthesis C-methylase UbiE
MLLNRVEALLVNNPIRVLIQRRFEAARLLRMGGPMRGGVALEVGCGRGVGIGVILDRFGAERVHAFDLDPRMVARARRRAVARGARAAVWLADITAVPVADGQYDAVFDFGVVHHVPKWRAAVAEMFRVLRPGGRLYAEEVFGRFINRFPWRQLLDHPREDRFDHDEFVAGLAQAGFTVLASQQMRRDFGWFVAEKGM